MLGGMKRKSAAGVLVYLVIALSACSAQDATHVTVAGRDVAVWKPSRMAPATAHPLILFSHGFGGCNTQTVFLMEALANAGYLVLAPNHQDARCGSARHAGGGMRKPEAPFRDAEKWSDATYRDRRDDMEAVLNSVLAAKTFEGVQVDAGRVGIAGHSLGGYTVLGLAGGWKSWKDPRIKAALALSPHCSPFVAKGDLGTMDVPMMYQGGTRDFGESPLLRKPGGAYDKTTKPKFYVEFEGAGHFAWTNLARKYQASIDAYGVAFFDAYLKGETERLSQLTGSARPKDVSDLRSAR
jgi:predicted dienelactone hydrolase